MNHIRRASAVWIAVVFALVEATQANGDNGSPRNTSADYFIYMPAMQKAQPPCDQTAVAQLRSASTWQGDFSVAFKANASGPWPSGDSEVIDIDRTMHLSTLVLTKTHDSPTFVQWKVGGFVGTGQLTVNDHDVYTFKSGGTAELSAQFTMAAGTDVMSISLYPDQCKLRFNLDGTAIGPVVGGLKPNAEFDFCATLDVVSPRSGAQAYSSSVPIFVTASEESSFTEAYKAGFHCRVGGGLPDAPAELFSNKLAWVLDGGTTSGARGKADAPIGSATVTYSFTPQP